MRISDWSSDVCSSDLTWRRVRPFPKVEAPKLRYLQENEARRLVNACDQAFRSMVQAALLTGARYAELAALEVRDYDPTSRTVWLRETKAGVARSVGHTSELQSLMRISYAVFRLKRIRTNRD